MSIIYEALKKVESSAAGNVELKPKARKPTSGLKVYLIYLSVIGLGLFIGNIIFNFLLTPKPSPAAIKNRAQPPAVTSPEAALQEVVKPQEKFPPSLVLNGVFFSKDEGYCLLNNRIVKEGDKIDGATVVRINLDAVELQFEGSLIRISTQNN